LNPPYATVAHERVRLRAGRLARVTLNYATFAPKSTRAVPASGTVSLVGGPSGSRVLTLSGLATRGVKAGEILASGPTASAPDGYLVKVVRVVSTRGGRFVLDVENATLLQALPSGEIDVDETLTVPAGAASVGHASGELLRQASPVARSTRAVSPSARAAGFSLPAVNLTCTTSAGVHLTPTVSFSPQIAFHAKWGFLKLDSASFAATVDEAVSLSASASAGASCQTTSPGIGLLAHPVKLPTIDVQVGPVPVVIIPTLQVYLSGSAGVTASLTASLQDSSSVTVGASYANGQFTPISSFSPKFGQSFMPEGDANGELALRPTVDTTIYGVAGPSFDIGAAAKFDANTASSPWWTLQGCLQGGIGFVVDILKINWSKPDLISLCKTLLSANGGYSGGGGSGGGETGGGIVPMAHRLTSGYYTTCEIVTSGVNCWGTDPWGTDPLTPTSAPQLAGASDVATSSGMGPEDTCAVVRGAVYCWGTNEFGALGNGTASGYSKTPAAVAGITNAIAVATGGTHTCALLADATVTCWGGNEWGELGDGTHTPHYTPENVQGLGDVTEIAAGFAQSCALVADGTIYCWGTWGGLGGGTATEALAPVPLVEHAVAVSLGGAYGCALTSAGTVPCWGVQYDDTGSQNQADECGPGPTEECSRLFPNSARAVSVGGADSCAIVNGGSVECWGFNPFGQLGDGLATGASDLWVFHPEQFVTGISNASEVAAGANHVCARLQTGAIECWGYNAFGQLGDGSVENRLTPVVATQAMDTTSTRGGG
jgi:alpha-tubulin suppressor-like RCC1 family protein